MGQVFDKLRGKQWRHKQLRKITDKVFDHLKNQSGTATLSFEDLYIAVLLVYNDINKNLPGPHFDPPSKAKIKKVIEACDLDLNGELDREEFGEFMLVVTGDIATNVSQGLIISLIVAPAVAVATKKATEGIPRVGNVVQKLPNSVYASIITLGVVIIHRAAMEFD